MKLILLEWKKMKGHPFFWIGLSLYAVSMIALIFLFGNITLGATFNASADGTETGFEARNFADIGFYKLPFIWQNITYFSGFFKFIPVFLLIFFVAGEFQFKTFRQNIIDGLSTSQFYYSKVLTAFLFAALSLLFVLLPSLIMAASYNEGATGADYLNRMDYFVAYFSEVLFMMMFALFVTLLVKRSAVAIILILIYYFIAEPLIGLAIGEPIKDYLPTRPSRKLIQQPFLRLLNVDSFLGIETPDSVPVRFLVVNFVYIILLGIGGHLMVKRVKL